MSTDERKWHLTPQHTFVDKHAAYPKALDELKAATIFQEKYREV
jgi:hypothetical protein